MADEHREFILDRYSGGDRWLPTPPPYCMRHVYSAHMDGTNQVGSGRCLGERGNHEGDRGGHGGRRASSSVQPRGRANVYYSPPGTSYATVERPPAMASRNQQYSEAQKHLSYQSHPPPHQPPSHSPRSLPRTSGTKRPMSPEEVLKMFGTSSGRGKTSSRRVQSPASSTPSFPPLHPPCYRPYLHQNTHDDAFVRTVSMARQPESNHGFGICVKGGKDSDDSRAGVYISRVEEGSVADRAGLRPGDSILEVNGTPFNSITHEEALKVLKSNKRISMTVKSANVPHPPPPHSSPPSSGGPWYMRRSYSWMDRRGRPVSPPPEYVESTTPPELTPSWIFANFSKYSCELRRVDLRIDPGQSLGLMIRGGLEYNLGIFITGVDRGSVAERAGLSVGDQILEVNGLSFLDATHDEAVNQLKINKRMTLLVRAVGKVPHSCTAYDDYLRLQCFSNSSGDYLFTTKELSPILQMVEEKARVLLTRNELMHLSYYQDEYARGHITTEAFVTVLLELLNTPDKHTLLTELRELIIPEDRDLFDDLVYGTTPCQNERHDHRRKVCDSPIAPANLQEYHEDVNEYFGGSKACKIPVQVEGLPLESEGFNTPSEDSGVCLGDGRTNERASWMSPPSPAYKKQTSNLTLSNGDCSNISQSGYLEGLKSQFDGWTQRVKSWYWGRPLELTHKLSRSFDMKEEQRHLDAGGGTVRRHQSMQRLSRSEPSGNQEEEDPLMGPTVVPDQQGNLRITVSKTKPILGIAIEGGANTRHPLPRIINIHENGAAFEAGGLEVGQLILEVDGQKVEGMHHQEIARLIAESFARKERHEIEFLVVEAKKSNLEPKPTALIFLEA